ncbi:MAG TPA: calcium-binding protein [Acidimicrobiales bacterium]
MSRLSRALAAVALMGAALVPLSLAATVAPASAAEPVIGTPMIVEDSGSLYSVGCPTPTTCIAVGPYFDGSGGYALVVITDGVPGPAQLLPGRGLAAVACPDAITCYTVGNNEVTTITNGTVGATQTVDVQSLDDVACADATTCYAVGQKDGAGVVVPIVNGVVGAPQPIPDTSGYGAFSIACPTPTTCWLVGSHFIFETFSYQSVVVPMTDGTVGQPGPPYASRLTAIACSDATTCYAVNPRTNELVPIVNGVVGTPIPAPEEMALMALTCPTATTCYAVGRTHAGVGAAVVPIVDGVFQAVQIVPGFNDANLYDVACGSATTCQATGIYNSQGFVVSITVPTACTITGAGDITGTPSDDVICGSAGPDRIAGLGGNDIIFGLGGADQLSGGSGNDQLFGGGGGVDRLSGGPGDDSLDTVDGSGGDYALGGEHVSGDTCVVDPGDFTAQCER